jgi:hypothetical protein
MHDIARNTDPLSRDSGFNRALNLVEDLQTGKDRVNRERRLILKKYKLLYKGFNVLQKKVKEVDHKRRNSYFTDWPLVGTKTNSNRIETAIPNIISVIDTVVEWEKWMSKQKLPQDTKDYIRRNLSKGIVNLAYKPIFHTKLRNLIVLTGTALLVAGCALLASYFTAGLFPVGVTVGALFQPSILIWLGLGAAVSGGGVLWKFPLTWAGEELIYQLSSKEKNFFDGFAQYKKEVLVDLVKSLKKIDLTNKDEVANVIVPHSGSPLKLHKASKLEQSFDLHLLNGSSKAKTFTHRNKTVNIINLQNPITAILARHSHPSSKASSKISFSTKSSVHAQKKVHFRGP